MSAISTMLPSTPNQLRPFDIRRDLDQVADLVETCFAETLDEDGKRYVRQMHSAARNPSYLRWASAVADQASIPLSGFVWEENGKVVGNLSLIPFLSQGRQHYLIANVAVAPDHRRRGIARALTEAAIRQVRSRGVGAVWLHVRDDNVPAFNLYTSLGFVEKARRTTWELSARKVEAFVPYIQSSAERVVIGKIRPNYWPQQRHWLQATYPPELTWHMPVNFHALRSDVWGSLYRLVSGIRVEQWAATRDQQLLGVLTWQPHMGQADRIWLAAEPEKEAAAFPALLAHLHRTMPDRPRMILDYPAGRGSREFGEADFRLQQTLIWMEARLKERG
jgi:ribosomal protein S18 acetylase RimI-like enzyme